MLIAILADDLTGALDAAAPFAARGLEVAAIPSWDLLPSPADLPAVLAVNTETRHVSPRRAARIAADCARRLKELGAPRILKKIDSTLRGPWTAELDAIRQELGALAVPICPAFPAQGRTVVNGDLRINGRRFASCSRRLIRRGPVRRLPGVRPVSAAVRQAAAAFRAAAADGCPFVLADALDDGDLRGLVAAAGRAGCDRLLCGSAGLAGAWAAAFSPNEGPTPVPPEAAGRILVVVGSRQPATRAQLLALRRRPGPRDDPSLQVLATDPGDPGGRDDPREAERIGREAVRCHAELSFDALVLSGGEAASAVLRRLGARRLRLEGELAPGIPLSRLHGGLADGRLCVTKAGGFGGPECLLRIVRILRGNHAG